MAIGSGSYAPYHLYNIAAGAGEAGVTGALVRNNLAYTGAGVWPFNDTERDILWSSGIGITCVEWFFYLDDIATPTNQSRYLFEFKSRYDNRGFPDTPPGAAESNRSVAGLAFYHKAGGNQAGKLRWQSRAISSAGNSINVNVYIGTPAEVFINTGEWYHSIVRYNSDTIKWECLLGNMGRTYDGQVSTSQTSDLSQITNGASNAINQGEYVRFEGKTMASLPDRGPLALSWGWRDMSPEFNDTVGGTDRGAFTKHAILTKSEGVPTPSNNLWLDHLWLGGIGEIRFWQSDMDNVKTYEQLMITRDAAPFYNVGENSDLIHCWRFNNTSDLTATGQEDVGKYTGKFDQYDQYIQHRAGWPYDISEPNAVGEVKLLTGFATGVAEQVDFYGAAWAQDSAGNPIYREQPAYPLVPNNLDPTAGIEDYGGVEVRAIVSDLYTTSNLYWLPGTGTVVQDDEDSSMYNLVLPAFYINTGYGAIFSDVYLIDNEVYLAWLINTSREIPYFENRSVGPFLLAASDTSGTVSLSFMGAD